MAKVKPQEQALTTRMSDQLPDFMRGEGLPDTLGEVMQYTILPRVKVVQALSKEPYRPRFREGDVVASPLMVPIVTSDGDPRVGQVLFHFIPILFYPEWITWNPRNSGMRAVRARSFDYRSDIAIKARNPETRKENCPDAPLKEGKPQVMKHLEHLNFVFMIVGDHELAEFPLTMTFASGEHQAGSRFNTLITMRGTKQIYGCQFAAKLGRRKNNDGEWLGLDIDNPEPDSGVTPFVQDRARFESLGKIWKEYNDIYAAKRLRVNMDDMESADEETTAAAESRF